MLNSTHRRPLQRLLGMVVTLSLAALPGCGFVGASESEDTLVFGGFGGSLEEGMKKQMIPAFEKKYGIEVTYVEGTSDELIAKARNATSGIDVIWTNDTTHHDGKAEQLFAKLDRELVPNLEKVYEVARDPDDIGVATGIQAMGLHYNTAVFERRGWDPPTSWSDLFDPRFGSHVAGYNIPIGYANLLLLQLANVNGGGPSNLEPGWAKLEQLVDTGGAWVDPPEQMTRMLATGSAWVAFNGSSRVFASKVAGDPVDFVYPDEGAVAYPQYFDVLKSAPHPELAQRFVNFALSKQAQVGMAKVAMMGPVTADARLSRNVAATVPYGPEQVDKLNFLESGYLNQHLTQITNRWTRLVGGA
jgi:putative spermidine/putrescine transport system substrate-binding protein